LRVKLTLYTLRRTKICWSCSYQCF